MKTSTTLITLTAALASGQLFAAAIVSDLSDDPTNPSIFNTFTNNSLSLSGEVTNSNNTGGATGNIDFFNVQIPNGFQLESITLNSFTGDGLAFVGFAQGSTIPASGLDNNSSSNAAGSGFPAIATGFTLVSDGNAGDDILPFLLGGTSGQVPANAFDATASEFAFIFQNTGSNANIYDLTFEIAPIPEPASAALLALGSLTILRRRR